MVFSLMFCAVQAGMISGLEIGMIGAWQRGLWVLGATIMLLFVPRVPMPTPLKRGLVSISAASFMIYITHVIPIHVFKHWLGIDFPVAIIAISVSIGMITYFGTVNLKRHLHKRVAPDEAEVTRSA